MKKELANGFEDIEYSYNTRGWLTKINNVSAAAPKLFAMELKYNEAPNPRFNGNIGQTQWKNPFESIRNTYDYTYDKMNRLTKATYTNNAPGNTMNFNVPNISYDLNGNIKTLQRRGNHNDIPNQLIDNLTYTYNKGNQLSKVTDASGVDSGFRDGTNVSDEYLYDANGNMIADKNKGITSITYNHLNLPSKVSFNGTKYIEYTYDASGNKLTQKTVDGGNTKVSDYLGGFVYEDNKLQFLQHQEGRVVAKRSESGVFQNFEYQYYLKDHLGNVRTTFKTQTEVDPYLAALESGTSNYENDYFSRYGEMTRINASIFNKTPGSGNSYSFRLTGAGNEKYGLAKSLAVKPGDKIDAEVYVKYLDPSTTGTPGSSFAQLISNLSNNVSSVVVDGATAGTNPMPFGGLIGYGGDNSTGPKAYLNVLVFDQNYQLLSSSYKPITSVAKEDGTNVPHQYLKLDQITIQKPGYVYIYTSNENPTPVEVFFDDFKVTHTNTPIVQKDDYYPFGMTFSSYSAPSGVGQKYKFNGKEREELTGWDDFGARMYMSDLGKWGVVDPMADQREWVSPYNFVQNNPLSRIDPDGLTDYEINSKGEVVKTIENKKADNFYMVDNDGNRIEGQSITFDYGTVESHRSQSGTYQKRNADGTRSKEVTTIDIFKVRGDDNGTQLFEFFADNTSVEWSQAKTGIEGDKGLNFLTIGHIEYTEPGIAALINGQLSGGYTIRELNHNHPGGTAVPSGIPGLTGSSGDVSFAKTVTEWYKKAYPNRSNSPTYNIYVTGKGYIPYSKDSKKEDYGY
ncbi:JAB-like toxin 1 domain-containing protein [Belliella pelovolcani]|uniref:JAB-like toxin 1 domain-containing protein n=1 Tax=Belliella pelovolcani TaxID=529505 RepID=UPI00391C9F8A